MKITSYPIRLAVGRMIQALPDNPNRKLLGVYMRGDNGGGFNSLIYGIYFGVTNTIDTAATDFITAQSIQYAINYHYRNFQLDDILPAPKTAITLINYIGAIGQIDLTLIEGI